MPLPKPGKKESKKEWLDRCMANDTMVSEFPDNDQRYAVCNQKWRDKDKKKSDEEYEMTIKEKDNKEQKPKIERRSIPINEFRFSKQEDGSLKFEGYPAKFNRLSQDIMGFKEKINPGAFANTIQNDDIRALWEHESKYVLGRTKNGTLTLEEDDKGLRMVNIPPDTQWARDLAVSVERKDIDKMSFGFKALKDSWDETGKIPIRTLEEVELKDVSIVTFPAYLNTSVQMRSQTDQNLIDSGIDLDAISRVLVKSQHGLEVNDEDCAEIDATIESLTKLKPQVDETIEKEVELEPEQTHRVKILRKKLDLIEKN